MVVLDWQNRGIGEIAAPLWLLPAARGDWEQFRQSWKNLDSDKILKLGVANNAGRNVAMTIADVQYAARLANQLKQTVLTRAAISLGSDGEFDAVNDAATKTLVNIAGQERLTDFWQQIETTDEKGKKSTVYNYYVVYACDSGVWDQLVAKYLYDIIGVLPEKKTQQTMADLFGEINAEIKTQKPKTEAEFKAELAAQQQALAKPLSPAEQRAAYRSGESAKVAAASTTSADTDYVAALALLANSK
jgi:putative heme degradation protein